MSNTAPNRFGCTLAELNQRTEAAFEDALIWRETTGITLERCAKLACRYHKAPWCTVLELMSAHYRFKSGRPSRSKAA